MPSQHSFPAGAALQRCSVIILALPHHSNHCCDNASKPSQHYLPSCAELQHCSDIILTLPHYSKQRTSIALDYHYRPLTRECQKLFSNADQNLGNVKLHQCTNLLRPYTRTH